MLCNVGHQLKWYILLNYLNRRNNMKRRRLINFVKSRGLPVFLFLMFGIFFPEDVAYIEQLRFKPKIFSWKDKVQTCLFFLLWLSLGDSVKFRWLYYWRKEVCVMFCSFQCSRNCLENCVVHRRISISQLENIVSKLKSLFSNVWKEHSFRLFGELLGPIFKSKIQKHICASGLQYWYQCLWEKKFFSCGKNHVTCLFPQNRKCPWKMIDNLRCLWSMK